jgi:hypothetical protein
MCSRNEISFFFCRLICYFEKLSIAFAKLSYYILKNSSFSIRLICFVSTIAAHANQRFSAIDVVVPQASDACCIAVLLLL